MIQEIGYWHDVREPGIDRGDKPLPHTTDEPYMAGFTEKITELYIATKNISVFSNPWPLYNAFLQHPENPISQRFCKVFKDMCGHLLQVAINDTEDECSICGIMLNNYDIILAGYRFPVAYCHYILNHHVHVPSSFQQEMIMTDLPRAEVSTNASRCIMKLWIQFQMKNVS